VRNIAGGDGGGLQLAARLLAAADGEGCWLLLMARAVGSSWWLRIAATARAAAADCIFGDENGGAQLTARMSEQLAVRVASCS
jgi:hypothetical protein